MLPDNILSIAGQSRITTEEAIMLCEAKIDEAKKALAVGIEMNNEKRISRNEGYIAHWTAALENVKNADLTDVLIVDTLFDPACVATGKVGMLYKRK